MRAKPRPAPSSELLSHQVSETAYFFLNLAPARNSLCTVSAGGRERCNPDYLIRRRKYGYTVIEFVVEGSGYVLLDGTKFPLSPGSVFTYKRDTLCEIHTDPVNRLVKYFVCLSGKNASAQLARAGLPPPRALQLASHTELQSLLAQMVREGQSRTTFSQTICDTLLQLLLLKLSEALARKRERPQAGRDKFLRVKHIIDARADSLRTLEEVAREAGVSTVAACKLFNQHLGQSPFRYLMRRKMEIAAEHLMNHGGLIKEAAAHVGFSDACHFSRRFKQSHGIAPTAMRSLQRATAG